MNRYLAHAFIGLSLVALLAGCGGTSLPEVEGTVTLNGKPIDNVRVEFLPDPEQQTTGPRSMGVSDAQGRFRLTCETEKGGAVVGTHRVVITDLKQWEGLSTSRADAEKPLKRSRVPGRYTNVLQTPFKSIEVKADGTPLKLDLTTR